RQQAGGAGAHVPKLAGTGELPAIRLKADRGHAALALALDVGIIAAVPDPSTPPPEKLPPHRQVGTQERWQRNPQNAG
ncbi:hypothetical protein chiPu_0026610, partial [Chiloscyllium punctatum]|nr:hypothetical protein [Chiloscyllium punctatum]